VPPIRRGRCDIAGVVAQLAGQFPGHLIGVQMNGGNPYIFQVPADLSEAEQTFVAKAQAWMQAEGAYASLQSTKPQTLGVALNDSPVGLASWLEEKYRAWSDCDGDVLTRFSRDELLTFVMLYWLPGTITSSMRIYYEGAHDPTAWGPSAVKAPGDRPPTALAVWPGDIAVPPREWAERTGPLARYTVMPRGGTSQNGKNLRSWPRSCARYSARCAEWLRSSIPPLVRATVLSGQGRRCGDALLPGCGRLGVADPFENAAFDGPGKGLEVRRGRRMRRERRLKVWRHLQCFNGIQCEPRAVAFRLLHLGEARRRHATRSHGSSHSLFVQS
jgi:hypothetical protein